LFGSLPMRRRVIDRLDPFVDIRTQQVVKGRSINMALSRRGRDALAYINCEDTIVNNGIPMHARMLHAVDCSKQAVPYGTSIEHVRHTDVPDGQTGR
jgi:kynurenine 3-monooxygenase